MYCAMETTSVTSSKMHCKLYFHFHIFLYSCVNFSYAARALHIVLENCRCVVGTWIYEQREQKYFTYHYARQQNGNHIWSYPYKIVHKCAKGMNLTHTCDIYPNCPRRKVHFCLAICYSVIFCQASVLSLLLLLGYRKLA